MGGLGRTGTIAVRLLAELGMPADDALAAVRRARPDTEETTAQERHTLATRPLRDDAWLDRALGALAAGMGGGQSVDRACSVASHGQGWVGEEALAIGLYAALVATSFPDALTTPPTTTATATPPPRSRASSTAPPTDWPICLMIGRGDLTCLGCSRGYWLSYTNRR